jgi:hypothetical protein
VDSLLLLGRRRVEGRGRDATLVVVVVVMTAARRMAKSMVHGPAGAVGGLVGEGKTTKEGGKRRWREDH